jgi:predicted small secreted protein
LYPHLLRLALLLLLPLLLLVVRLAVKGLGAEVVLVLLVLLLVLHRQPTLAACWNTWLGNGRGVDMSMHAAYMCLPLEEFAAAGLVHQQ